MTTSKINKETAEPVLKEVTAEVKRSNVVLAVLFGMIALASTMIPLWTASRMGITG